MSVLQYDTASSRPGAVLPLSGDFAGYISGLFDNYRAILAARPHSLVLPIFTRLPEPGELDGLRQVAFDVENGDLTPAQIRAALQAAWDAGIPCPVVYGSGDTWTGAGGLDEQLAGLERGVVYQGWLADPDADPTVPDGFAAKQYLFGTDFDTTIVLNPNTFYNLAPAPKPPTPEEIMAITAVQNQDGRLEVFVEAQDGSVWHTYQNKPNGQDGWAGGKPGVAAAELEPLAPAPK